VRAERRRARSGRHKGPVRPAGRMVRGRCEPARVPSSPKLEQALKSLTRQLERSSLRARRRPQLVVSVVDWSTDPNASSGAPPAPRWHVMRGGSSSNSSSRSSSRPSSRSSSRSSSRRSSPVHVVLRHVPGAELGECAAPGSPVLLAATPQSTPRARLCESRCRGSKAALFWAEESPRLAQRWRLAEALTTAPRAEA
jgi:hypothetical protein